MVALEAVWEAAPEPAQEAEWAGAKSQTYSFLVPDKDLVLAALLGQEWTSYTHPEHKGRQSVSP